MSGPYDPVKRHLSRSLTLLSDRKNPDYRNSIKEAISAVEALSKIVTGKPKASLGDALTILEQRGEIHGALKTSFSALYGYASDADGIRHAMLEEPSIGQEDARLMLVVCSAFTNYVIAKLN